MTSSAVTGRSFKVPTFQHRVGLPLHRALMRPFRRRPRFLLVLGTMRSGTSLVTNVLMSNPGIAGFGESHVVYDRPDRLLDLRYWIFRYTHRYPRRDQFLLDKVLHTQYTPDLSGLLRQCDPHVLVLVRDPGGVTRSFVNTWKHSEDKVWSRLGARYRDLAGLLGEIPSEVPMAALSYEALIEAPGPTLGRISDFLGLTEPLRETYEVPRWVGAWGVGDGSEKIRSGRIDPRPRPPALQGVPSAVGEAYEALLERLAARGDPVLL